MWLSSFGPRAVTGASGGIMYVVFDLVAQTFVFGVYTLVFCLSTRMLLKRGLKTRTSRVAMLFVTLFMYLLSTAYWAYTIVYVINLLHQHLDIQFQSLADHDEISKWYPLLNSVVMINFVLGDCVVAWRAWVISHRGLRKYLWITMGLVALTAIAVALTIAFRIVAFIQSPINNLGENNMSYVKSAIDILQVSTGVLSLFSNLSATAVVGITAWRHRRVLRDAFTEDDSTSQTDKILGLVVEVGAFSCLSTLILLIASLIRIPYGTLGDLYAPINVHVAGAYPPAVILLISMNRSLGETAFSDSAISAPLHFASADASPTTTVGGPEIILKTTPTAKQRSHFSDSSFDPTYDVQ
ncbi:hypothetical protein B0H14DRAFT_670569 [Mycena olivaceomarginata]|nr:hypothetical protein B0H14DRAFT_670569 [Mycena olivaceomarginata]